MFYSFFVFFVFFFFADDDIWYEYDDQMIGHKTVTSVFFPRGNESSLQK